jgi:DNA-binding CsgD family transcriptional regulator
MYATAFADTRVPAATGAAFRPVPASPGYAGPERRQRRDWLAAALDELDYGMLLLTDTGHVVRTNHVAQLELDREHPLQLLGRELRARHAQDVVPLHTALQNAAQRGLRKLLTLGAGAHRVSVSVVPIGAEHAPGEASTLVILGKREVCEPLSVQGFARSNGLTPAETRVLVALCQGVPPTEAAAELGVGIATVRSQIGSIRQKTGAESIRALVRQVAVLPPLMGVLRQALTHEITDRQPMAA